MERMKKSEMYIDVARRVALVDGTERRMEYAAYEVLRYLAKLDGCVASMDQIALATGVARGRAVSQYVRRIRKEVGYHWIETVSKVGYKISGKREKKDGVNYRVMLLSKRGERR